MRIISGTYKARRIAVPGSFRARPTTDLAKENLFNILANYLDFNGLEVLDLFAGTGSISLEFVSRGAGLVVAVEIEKRYSDFISSTIDKLGIRQTRVIRSDAFSYIRNTADRFDLVFADPPYDMKETEILPDLILEYELLKRDGWLILEHGRDHDFSHRPFFFSMRRYGSVHFSLFVNG